MSSGLPFDTAIEKTVQQLGIGPYDSPEGDENAQSSDKPAKRGKSLPDGGGSSIDSPDTMTSYSPTPSTTASVRFEDVFEESSSSYSEWLQHMAYELRTTSGGVNLFPYGATPEFLELRRSIRGSSDVPGDFDRPPRGRRPEDDTLQSVVESVAQTDLPSDSDNPSSRSDYYDHTRQGLERAGDPGSSELWADEDTGAYASESLPTPMKNETERDNSLGALGNAWSGRTVEDTSNDEGFPSSDFSENVDFDRSDLDGGGKIMASGQRRVSTNIVLVQELTEGLIKRFGKKDLTRRHVMAFLQETGKSQYFASDVIRCLKLSHNIHVMDVLDEFPVLKTAGSLAEMTSLGGRISAIRDKMVDLEILHMDDYDTAKELRRCAAALSDVAAKVPVRLRGSND